MIEDDALPPASAYPVRRTAVVANARGLHARPAAQLAKLAERYDAEIVVASRRDRVSALSIMGLMMLAAAAGTRLTVLARGPEARAAANAVKAFLEQSEE